MRWLLIHVVVSAVVAAGVSFTVVNGQKSHSNTLEVAPTALANKINALADQMDALARNPLLGARPTSAAENELRAQAETDTSPLAVTVRDLLPQIEAFLPHANALELNRWAVRLRQL